MNIQRAKSQSIPSKIPSLRHGFFKNQLTWFLSIALLPILVISFLTISNTREHLTESARKSLLIVADQKARTIEEFFRNFYHTVIFQVRDVNTLEMLGKLELVHAKAGSFADEYLKNPDWQRFSSLYDNMLTPFMATNDYHDFFIIGDKGDILYTFNNGEDLGTNIFTGKFSQTTFGKTCRLAYKHEYPLFSDFEVYQPAGGLPVAFWVIPLFDQEGNKKGIVAAQIQISKLNKLMKTSGDQKKQFYLIGEDLLVRAGSHLVAPNEFLTVKNETLQARTWFNEISTSDVIFLDQHDHGRTKIYTNLSNQEVLGTHHDVEVGQVKLAVITEISTHQAFLIVKQQLKIAIFMFLGVALLVAVVAFYAAQRVTAPLNRLTTLANRVAEGDLEIEEGNRGTLNNEFGLVENSFARVVASLQEISLICEDISQGIFHKKATVRGEKDALARSVNSMIDNFEDIIFQAKAVAQGDLTHDISLRGEHDEIGLALRRMTENLRTTTTMNARNDWFNSGQAMLAEHMSGGKVLKTLSDEVIGFLAEYLNCAVGTLYIEDNHGEYYSLAGSYLFMNRQDQKTYYKEGEGLVGEAARKKGYLLLKDIGEQHIRIDSSLGHIFPRQIIALPLLLEDQVKGVIELGTLHVFTPEHIEFLEQAAGQIALAIHTAQEAQNIKELLEKTQAQAEELEVQQEELREANDRLLAQEEELRVSNEDLAEQSINLTKQKEAIEQTNRDLEIARQELIRKANELETSSQYKSEFLANMSHELRTPLNSLLLLANRLARNDENNLTEKQVKAARVIHTSGHHLLALINDILDLAKIEAGKMDISVDTCFLASIKNTLDGLFTAVAEEEGLKFTVVIDPTAPEHIITDRQRLQQILTNLISNSLKFTDKGSVSVHIICPAPEGETCITGLSHEQVVEFRVIDTGIGIASEKQSLIFEAFKQEDGTISRKYGGTGLGLSITRKLAQLLGGNLSVSSAEGQGATFTVSLPVTLTDERTAIESLTVDAQQLDYDAALQKTYAIPINDDRAILSEGDKVVLVIEDDMDFAQFLYDICHEKGFRCLHAPAGEKGVKMAKKYLPSAIILDLGLPGIPGLQVLDMIKDDSTTRHIPVQVISASEKTMEPLQRGAIGYLTKPVTDEDLDKVFQDISQKLPSKAKNLLVVEDDLTIQEVVSTLHNSTDIVVTTCVTGRDAVQLITENSYDCVILDIGLPDISGFEVLQQIRDKELPHPPPPVVIYTSETLNEKEQMELRKYANSVVLKGANSNERLLDETTLFLHAVTDDIERNDGKPRFSSHDTDSFMSGKKVLVVDDDMRNLFALAEELEEYGLQIVKATNGQEALEVLDEAAEEIDIVLMDIMMPVMNGYEAMKEIRQQSRFEKLPILALTAKAMREDRDHCIEAGANDYLPKPIDIDRLISTMRIWLKN